MKRIMFFCIPAHGHHNPTLPVVKALTDHGNVVRYYSFSEFEEKIVKTGAEFYNCDRFLPELTAEEENLLKSSSVTAMTINAIRTTANMDSYISEQIEEFNPDIIVSDSACFWGKLTARKHKIPLVVSTTTFAFNKFSSKYMKSSFAEIKDLIGGSKQVKAELKKLEEYGFYEKSVMPLVTSDNYTDTIVYATKEYQPCSDTFSEHYAFVGPSVFSETEPAKENQRPLVYISLGTVVNERPQFYQNCIEALKNKPYDVIISAGNQTDIDSLNGQADNITFYHSVNQLEILSRANVFVTHCGMNSVSESLYMATPMVTFPQTNEQRAVERRAVEMGAAVKLNDDSSESIIEAVEKILNDRTYSEKAISCCKDFRSAEGPEGAARFIESAPHEMPNVDKKMIRNELLDGVLQLIFWIIAVILIIFTKGYIKILVIVLANVLFPFYKKCIGTLMKN